MEEVFVLLIARMAASRFKVSNSSWDMQHLLPTLEQQRRKVDQIISPHHPRVRAGRFNGRHRNLFALEPRDEVAVPCDEVIFLSASNPEQVQTGTLSTQRRKLILFAVSHR